jgi:hypothetical protein
MHDDLQLLDERLAQTEIVYDRFATSVLSITGLGKKAVGFFARLARKYL